MNCPKCGSVYIFCDETRRTESHVISRRRYCSKCGKRWTTIELVLPLEAGGYKEKFWHVRDHYIKIFKSVADRIPTHV